MLLFFQDKEVKKKVWGSRYISTLILLGKYTNELSTRKEQPF